MKLLKIYESISPKLVYRGGLELDPSAVKGDGISVSQSKEMAEYWASSRVGGKVFTYKLNPSANILTTNNFPTSIIPREKPYTHQDKERIVNYAKVKGYDGVDLSGYFHEHEIRIFNVKSLVSV